MKTGDIPHTSASQRDTIPNTYIHGDFRSSFILEMATWEQFCNSIFEV